MYQQWYKELINELKYPTQKTTPKTITMANGILNTNIYQKMFQHYLQSFKFHFNDSLLAFFSGTFAFITLQDVPLIITIIGTGLGTLGLPVYFGYRRYRKQEEREIEMAIIKAIKDLRELGFILPDDSIEVQRQKAIDWLSKPTNNV